MRCLVLPLAVAIVATASSALADSNSGSISLMTLRLMRDKGIITQAEYDSALADMKDTGGEKAGDTESVVMGKWSATLYGFVEGDYLFDTTQSFSDLAGSGLVARPGTYSANNYENQFSIRNSRFGFRFRAPEYHQIRASALMEFDFLGDWASPAFNTTSQNGANNVTGQPASNASPSENQYFTSPVPRVRHMYLKLETPVVDVLIGQYWQLLGWETDYHPNTVQYQGVPGELYARTPQLRISKTIHTNPVTVNIAVAALRPVQRDSAVPEGEAGLKIAFNKWTGVQTMGATATRIAAASIGISGDIRDVALPNVPTLNTTTNVVTPSSYDINKGGASIAVDAFIPVIPGSKEHMGNSLSILGEFVEGTGIADLYSGFATGVTFPSGTAAAAAIPGVGGAAAIPAVAAVPYNPYLDSNIATINSNNQVTLIETQTIRAGLQYYFPGLDGKMWLSGNYANMSIPNASSFVTTKPAATPGGKPTSNTSSLNNALNWFDVCLFGDLTPAVRLGAEYAYYTDKYMDGVSGKDHRVQLSAYYIF